jgi:hypothetical protein
MRKMLSSIECIRPRPVTIGFDRIQASPDSRDPLPISTVEVTTRSDSNQDRRPLPLLGLFTPDPRAFGAERVVTPTSSTLLSSWSSVAAGRFDELRRALVLRFPFAANFRSLRELMSSLTSFSLRSARLRLVSTQCYDWVRKELTIANHLQRAVDRLRVPMTACTGWSTRCQHNQPEMTGYLPPRTNPATDRHFVKAPLRFAHLRQAITSLALVTISYDEI